MLHKMLKLYEVTTCVYLRPQHWKGPFEPFRNLRETGFKVFIKTEICAGKGHSSIFTNKPSNWTNVPYHCQKNEMENFAMGRDIHPIKYSCTWERFCGTNWVTYGWQLISFNKPMQFNKSLGDLTSYCNFLAKGQKML